MLGRNETILLQHIIGAEGHRGSIYKIISFLFFLCSVTLYSLKYKGSHLHPYIQYLVDFLVRIGKNEFKTGGGDAVDSLYLLNSLE